MSTAAVGFQTLPGDEPQCGCDVELQFISEVGAEDWKFPVCLL